MFCCNGSCSILRCFYMPNTSNHHVLCNKLCTFPKLCTFSMPKLKEQFSCKRDQIFFKTKVTDSFIKTWLLLPTYYTTDWRVEENLFYRFSICLHVIFLKGGPHFRAPWSYMNQVDKFYGSKVALLK